MQDDSEGDDFDPGDDDDDDEEDDDAEADEFEDGPDDGQSLVLSFVFTHTHTQPFYCSSGICPGPPG